MKILRYKIFSGYDAGYKRTHTAFGDYNHSMIIGQEGRDLYRKALENPKDKDIRKAIKKYESLDGDYRLLNRDIRNRVAAADYYDGYITQKEYLKRRDDNQKVHQKQKEKERYYE